MELYDTDLRGTARMYTHMEYGLSVKIAVDDTHNCWNIKKYRTYRRGKNRCIMCGGKLVLSPGDKEQSFTSLLSQKITEKLECNSLFS